MLTWPAVCVDQYQQWCATFCLQVPALKQHYDRVLADLQRERDALVNEKNVILQVRCVHGCLCCCG
jgi:hypothetical protein